MVELPADEEEGLPAELYAFVNPEIVKASRDTEEGRGRLSFDPRLHRRGGSAASSWWSAEQDAFGQPQRIKAHDYLARIFQHEIDHLDGVMFIDRGRPEQDPKITAEEAGPPTGEVAEAAAFMG